MNLDITTCEAQRAYATGKNGATQSLGNTLDTLDIDEENNKNKNKNVNLDADLYVGWTGDQIDKFGGPFDDSMDFYSDGGFDKFPTEEHDSIGTFDAIEDFSGLTMTLLPKEDEGGYYQELVDIDEEEGVIPFNAGYASDSDDDAKTVSSYIDRYGKGFTLADVTSPYEGDDGVLVPMDDVNIHHTFGVSRQIPYGGDEFNDGVDIFKIRAFYKKRDTKVIIFPKEDLVHYVTTAPDLTRNMRLQYIYELRQHNKCLCDIDYEFEGQMTCGCRCCLCPTCHEGRLAVLELAEVPCRQRDYFEYGIDHFDATTLLRVEKGLINIKELQLLSVFGDYQNAKNHNLAKIKILCDTLPAQDVEIVERMADLMWMEWRNSEDRLWIDELALSFSNITCFEVLFELMSRRKLFSDVEHIFPTQVSKSIFLVSCTTRNFASFERHLSYLRVKFNLTDHEGIVWEEFVAKWTVPPVNHVSDEEVAFWKSKLTHGFRADDRRYSGGKFWRRSINGIYTEMNTLVLRTQGWKETVYNKQDKIKTQKKMTSRLSQNEIDLVHYVYKKKPLGGRIYYRYEDKRGIMQIYYQWLVDNKVPVNKIDLLDEQGPKCNFDDIAIALGFPALSPIVYVAYLLKLLVSRDLTGLLAQFAFNSQMHLNGRFGVSIVTLFKMLCGVDEIPLDLNFDDDFNTFSDISPMVEEAIRQMGGMHEAVEKTSKYFGKGLEEEPPLDAWERPEYLVLREQGPDEPVLLALFTKMLSAFAIGKYTNELIPGYKIAELVSSFREFDVNVIDPIKAFQGFWTAFHSCLKEFSETGEFGVFWNFDTYEKWAKDFAAVQAMTIVKHQPVLGYYDEILDSLRTLDKRLVKLLKFKKIPTTEFNKYAIKIRTTISEIGNRATGTALGVEAFGLFLWGPPGTTKSTIIDTLHHQVCAMEGLDPTGSLYDYQATSSHQTGAGGGTITVRANDVQMSDAGDKKFPEVFNVMRSFVDTVAAFMHQASLEDKMNSLMRVKLAAICTNDEFINAGEITCPEKINRRYPYMFKVVKKYENMPPGHENVLFYKSHFVLRPNQKNIIDFVIDKKSAPLEYTEFLEWSREAYKQHFIKAGQKLETVRKLTEFCPCGRQVMSHPRVKYGETCLPQFAHDGFCCHGVPWDDHNEKCDVNCDYVSGPLEQGPRNFFIERQINKVAPQLLDWKTRLHLFFQKYRIYEMVPLFVGGFIVGRIIGMLLLKFFPGQKDVGLRENALVNRDKATRFLPYGVPRDVPKERGGNLPPANTREGIMLNSNTIKTTSLGNLLNVIKSCKLTFKKGPHTYVAWVVDQSFIMMNHHFLRVFSEGEAITFKQGMITRVYIYRTADVIRIGNSDLAFLPIPGCGNGLRPFMREGHHKTLTSGKYVEWDSLIPEDVKVLGAERYVPDYGSLLLYEYSKQTSNGACGSILLTEIDGFWGVAGFHSFGDGKLLACSTPVYTSLLPKGLVIQCLVDIPNTVVIGNVHAKSHLNYMNTAVEVGVKPTRQSKSVSARRSALYDTFSPLLSEPYDIPGKIQCGYYNGEWRAPAKKKADGINLTEVLDYDIMNEFVDYFVDRTDVKLEPYSPGVAIEGLCGAVKGMNPNTSNGPGFEFIKNKHELIVDGEVVEWFQDELIAMLVDMLDGNLEAWHTTWQVKMESLKKSKIDKFDTRIFSVGTVPLNVLCKMFLGPIVEHMLNNFALFRCTGKINATSKQWDALHKDIFKFPFKLFADQSGFDAKHRMMIYLMLGMLMMGMAKKVGYSDEAQRLCFTLTVSAFYQLIELNGDFVYFEGMLPSGFYLTLILNSLAHLFLWFFAYKAITGNGIEKFFEEVSVAFTGDDIAGSTSCEKFNLLAIRDVFASLGYKLTSSIKDAELQKFSLPEEEVFLKRTWRFEERFGQYVAPLNLDSIIKALLFYEMGKGTTEATKLAQSLDGYQREMFFHGEETFVKYVEPYRAIFKEYGVRELAYDDLCALYLESNPYFEQWDQNSVV